MKKQEKEDSSTQMVMKISDLPYSYKVLETKVKDLKEVEKEKFVKAKQEENGATNVSEADTEKKYAANDDGPKDSSKE